jgi:hypothetical protein
LAQLTNIQVDAKADMRITKLDERPEVMRIFASGLRLYTEVHVPYATSSMGQE